MLWFSLSTLTLGFAKLGWSPDTQFVTTRWTNILCVDSLQFLWITGNSETCWSLSVWTHRLLMDVVQWGRMLWVWVQHHDKMIMIADVSSAALIKSGSEVLQNVSTLYHSNTMLYPNTPQGTQSATPSVSLCDGCQQIETTVWILTQLYTTIILVQSCWATQKTGVNLCAFCPGQLHAPA
jgi:hypothetical protein